MASGDTKTQQYLDIAARGTRADLQRGCCNTRTQDLIMDVAERIITEEETRYREDQILQSEIDEIKNNPDVYDIVATYADLQNYDTSTITDKDVIRVLRDETHDNASTYYRWDAADQEFDYIGETGDYYTKAQVNALLALKADKATTYTKTETDALLDGKQDVLTAGENITIVDESGSLVISAEGGGGATELTTADYNWPADNPIGVALWSLDSGWYTAPGLTVWPKSGTTMGFGAGSEALIYVNKAQSSMDNSFITIISNSGEVVVYSTRLSDGYASSYNPTSTVFVANSTGTSSSRVMSQNATTNAIKAISQSGSGAPTTSTVGTVGQLYQDTTNGKLYICTAADTVTPSYTWTEVGAGGGGGPTVVQTTGTSTTDVMSQNAVTSMVFADPSAKQKVQIGDFSSSSGNWGVAIGYNTQASNSASVGIGYNANASGNGGVAILGKAQAANSIGIGYNATASAAGAIALGSNSSSSVQGQMSIGTSNTSQGYNSSNYRLLTGLYDPQSAHDAATKGYVDTAVAGASYDPTISNNTLYL